MRAQVDMWVGRLRHTMARLPLGARRECCLCGARVGRFLPYRGGWRDAPPLLRSFRVIGSDLDNYLCPVCGCHDRERHLLLYLRQTGLTERIRGSHLLHFAPEARLTSFIERARPARYVLADLFPSRPGVERIDLLSIPYPPASFDMVVANHVMEHVADDLRALSEVRRVLKVGGHAILQTPYSDLLTSTFSDPGVCSDEARLQIYGQEDHVRLYGRDIFTRFASVGFANKVVEHMQALPKVDPVRYGVNAKEPFFLFEAI
jgi:SAM-dependent methyltransferase